MIAMNMKTKTKNYGNIELIETVGVGWTSGTTITERFPTLAPAMVISKFSLSLNLLFKKQYFVQSFVNSVLFF